MAGGRIQGKIVILAIDTSSSLAQICLWDTGTRSPRYAFSWQSVRAQTVELARAIQQAWAHSAQTAADMDLVAVCTGPGSYTGVRIGLSVAKGMSTGSTKCLPLMGVPALAPLLYSLWQLAQSIDCSSDLIVAQPAGRGYYNWAVMDGHTPWRYVGPQDHHWGTTENFAEFLRSLRPTLDTEMWVAGELSDELLAAVSALPHIKFLSAFDRQPSATQIARLAWHRWQTDPNWHLPQHLAPIYPQQL